MKSRMSEGTEASEQKALALYGRRTSHLPDLSLGTFISGLAGGYESSKCHQERDRGILL